MSSTPASENGTYNQLPLFELYSNVSFLDYEVIISILSFVAMLTWCFSDRKSKKYRFVESCSIPLMALLLFKYFIFFYGIISSPASVPIDSYFPFGKFHIGPRLVCLFFDIISGCTFFSIFYKYDTKFEYNGLQILTSTAFSYLVVLEFYILDIADTPPLYPVLNTNAASRIGIYFRCLLALHLMHLLLMQWKKKGLEPNKLFIFDGFLGFFRDIRDSYFTGIKMKADEATIPKQGESI